MKKIKESSGVSMPYIMLSEEDEQLLLDIHLHIYVDIEYILEKSYRGYAKTALYRRLKRMEEAGYIKHEYLPVPSVRGKKRKSGRPINVYTLTKFGVEMVKELRGIVHWNQRWTDRVATFVYHSLMLAHTESAMYSYSQTETLYELKEWINEPRATYKYTKSAKDILRPDGIAVVGRKGVSARNAGLLLEMERSYSTKEVLLKKVLRYNDFFKRGEEMVKKYELQVGFDYPIVLWKLIWIARDETRKKELLRHLQDAEQPPLYEIERDGETIYKQRYDILITTYDEVLQNPFGEIYVDLSDPTLPCGL
ncbi:replication-relaxation family protein [Bacillus mycoides]|uniref:replication-relaxation family protein n=1 Tax=Bacillus mycoides TaxID=1405 RepID=UPI003D9E4844